MLERLATQWLDYHHGRGEPHQYRYYRCTGCHRLVTWMAIREGGCHCGVSPHVRPARLTWGEKLRCLLLPWTV